MIIVILELVFTTPLLSVGCLSRAGAPDSGNNA